MYDYTLYIILIFLENLVFVGAHPDDAEIWAGGTLLKHKDRGAKVSLVVRNAEDLNKQEIAEQQNVCDKAEFDLIWYSTRQELIEAVTKIAPDIFITHWDEDSHPTHRLVSQDAIEAIAKCMHKNGTPTEMYYCNTYNALGRNGQFEPNHYVDITDYTEKKRELIRYFESKNPENWIRYTEQLTTLYGMRCWTDHAEGFRRFTMRGFYGAGSKL
ncbi:hypothetical protein C0416_01130 [bacterium]|nr:hypothetical protein [bacterium]